MNRKALIVVDVQNDFCPGGALAVKDGDQVVAPLNNLLDRMRGSRDWIRLASRDWHPKQTKHFKQNPEDSTGWPVHCVRDTCGAEFHRDLKRDGLIVLSKGTQPDEDAYSAFDGMSEYGNKLEEILAMNSTIEVFVGGLATDYCVKATVLDALKRGFKTTLLTDACRAVNLSPNDGDNAITEMVAAGAVLKTTEEVIHEMDN